MMQMDVASNGDVATGSVARVFASAEAILAPFAHRGLGHREPNVMILIRRTAPLGDPAAFKKPQTVVLVGALIVAGGIIAGGFDWLGAGFLLAAILVAVAQQTLP
jgi:hypothetical protein